METHSSRILTVNAGSSSIKFTLYGLDNGLVPLFSGQMERMGTAHTILGFTDTITQERNSYCVDTSRHVDASNFFLDWLLAQEGFDHIKAVGHRVVHGLRHTGPQRVTTGLLDELKGISAYDPEHLAEEIKLMELFQARYVGIPQIACFDTSFHTSMPPVARLLPIPRRFTDMGIQRYGFHGTSYAFLIEELQRVAGHASAHGKVIMAHLGNGASLCAAHEGKSVETSMGFTPASGIPMGTRTGDLDPGVAWYMMKTERQFPEQFSDVVNHQSGLLGMSGTSSDMRDLLKIRDTDTRAAEAIDLFCYQTKKCIGSFAAVLGGLDTLVFSGGIGEHAPEIRRQICDGLKFLGIELDEAANKGNEAIISNKTSKVYVRVIETNEQWMLAKSVCEIMGYAI